MDDQLNAIFKAYCGVLLTNLKAEEVSVEWAKEARELLKAMKYEAEPVPGSQLDKVKDELKGMPKFNQAS